MYKKDVEMTVLSEEDVFGWTEQEEIILSVLRKAEVAGNYRGNRLSIFDNKNNIITPVTDLVVLTGGRTTSDNPTKASFVITSSCDNKGDVRTYYGDGIRGAMSSSEAQGTVRPVLISEEVFLDLPNLVHSDNYEEVEYGEYPQYAAGIEMQKTLESAYNRCELNKLNASYSFMKEPYYVKGSSKKDVYPVYEYEGKKYIRKKVMPNTQHIKLSNGQELGFSVNDQYVWLEVSPVKWLLDKETKKFISKYGLVSGIDLDWAARSYRGYFSSTTLYDFLNHTMLKEMTQFKNMEIEKVKTK